MTVEEEDPSGFQKVVFLSLAAMKALRSLGALQFRVKTRCSPAPLFAKRFLTRAAIWSESAAGTIARTLSSTSSLLGIVGLSVGLKCSLGNRRYAGVLPAKESNPLKSKKSDLPVNLTKVNAPVSLFSLVNRSFSLQRILHWQITSSFDDNLIATMHSRTLR